MKNFKILDCTLRDGGYYTNWDFKPQLVEKYLKAMEELPIDYIEIGYRNLKQSVYKGEFFYTPLETLKKVKSLTSKSIVLIIDESVSFDFFQKALNINDKNNIIFDNLLKSYSLLYYHSKLF